jgi:hypothetical protein
VNAPRVILLAASALLASFPLRASATPSPRASRAAGVEARANHADDAMRLMVVSPRPNPLPVYLLVTQPTFWGTEGTNQGAYLDGTVRRAAVQ